MTFDRIAIQSTKFLKGSSFTYLLCPFGGWCDRTGGFDEPVEEDTGVVCEPVYYGLGEEDCAVADEGFEDEEGEGD